MTLSKESAMRNDSCTVHNHYWKHPEDGKGKVFVFFLNNQTKEKKNQQTKAKQKHKRNVLGPIWVVFDCLLWHSSTANSSLVFSILMLERE